MTGRYSAHLSIWVSPAEAAELAGLYSQRTFNRWAKENKIPAKQLPNGRWLILRTAVEELFAAPDTNSHGHSGDADPLVDAHQMPLWAGLVVGA